MVNKHAQLSCIRLHPILLATPQNYYKPSITPTITNSALQMKSVMATTTSWKIKIINQYSSQSSSNSIYSCTSITLFFGSIYKYKLASFRINKYSRNKNGFAISRCALTAVQPSSAKRNTSPISNNQTQTQKQRSTIYQKKDQPCGHN